MKFELKYKRRIKMDFNDQTTSYPHHSPVLLESAINSGESVKTFEEPKQELHKYFVEEKNDEPDPPEAAKWEHQEMRRYGSGGGMARFFWTFAMETT